MESGKPWDIPDIEFSDWTRCPDGCDYQDVESYMMSLFGFCGCGVPEAFLVWLRDVLGAVAARKDDGRFDWDRRDEVIGQLPEGPKWLVWFWLDAMELTEHGGNVSGGWLTERGVELLSRLELFYPAEGSANE